MKFYGKIGYGETVETVPGVWEEQITEREYFGDFMRNSSSLQSSDKVNDNFNISHSISIVADPYALEKFCFMRYVEFGGTKWKITNVEIQYPRLILSIGGVYNG